MPQLLSTAAPNAGYSLANSWDNPSQANPELALLALTVISQWSLLENLVNSVFVALLGENPKPAAAIYATIRSQAGQRDAFQSIVRQFVDDENLRDVLLACLEVFRKSSKLRNRIAHWVWGSCPSIPDSLLLADPERLTAESVDWQDRIQKFVHNPSPQTAPRGAAPSEGIWVYKKQDFLEGIEKIQKATGLLGTARAIVNSKNHNLSYAELLTQLSNAPEICLELNRQNRGRNNDR